MKEISKKITNYFCQYKKLSTYSEEIQFAISQILWEISTFLVALIGVYVFYGKIQSGIVFSIFFLPLRHVVGGAHAQSRIECISLTVCMFIIFTYYYYADIMWTIIFLGIVAWFIVWIKSPVQTSRHTLTIRQKKRNRKNTHKILLIYLAVGLWYIPINIKIVNSIFLVLIIIAMLMIAKTDFANRLIIPRVKKPFCLKDKMAEVVLEICLLTCSIVVNATSTHWNYETEIPRSIQRKFDNM